MFPSFCFLIQSKAEYNNVWQALQSSGPPQQPPAHWHNNVSLFVRVCVCVRGFVVAIYEQFYSCVDK